MKKKNRYKGHSLALFLIDGRQNRLNMNQLGNDIAHSLLSGSCTQLHEELEPFETENSTQCTGGYASSSHSGRGWNLVLEELS
ncbi:MAG: hypothetical protein PVF58_08580 [Candidatus Methanofastidiosia archaeon]|jgi:hypothetical protein